MGFMKSMDEANYNFEAQNKGWIYSWIDKFIKENIETMTPEIIETALINMPPIEAYNNPTEQMKNDKINAEHSLETLKQTLENQMKTGRSR